MTYGGIVGGLSSLASGVAPDQAIVNKFSHRDDLSTSLKDVWDHPDASLEYLGGIGSGETMDIVRASPTIDKVGGTGAHSITLFGIDDDGWYQEATYSLDGEATITTTEVWLRVWRVKVVGPSQAGGDPKVPNVGDITIQAATSLTVQSFVEAGAGITHMSHFTVPRGFVGVGIYLNGTTGSGKEVDLFSLVRESPLDGTVGPFIRGRNYKLLETGIEQTDAAFLPELTDVLFQAKTIAGSATIGLTFQVHLIKSSLVGSNTLKEITAQLSA